MKTNLVLNYRSRKPHYNISLRSSTDEKNNYIIILIQIINSKF